MTANVSFSAIHTFTVVAKELSFTRAAEILHITPSAVSHQMKLLEAQLKVALFHRKSQGVRLSLAGQALQRHATTGMRNIHYGIQQSQFASQKDKLVIAVIPSLCQLWLIPRLSDFCAQFPHIELELIALDKLADFTQQQFDGHLHFGSGDYKGLTANFLTNESVYPVCHPDLLNTAQHQTLVSLLKQHTLLLYKAGLEDEPGGVSWADWFQHFSIDKPQQMSKMWFSQVAMTLMAARQKQGIALAWHQMVADDIASGQLCRLGNQQLDTSYNYYLVAPAKSWQNQSFNTFSSWLQQQIRC
jgi:DNA-binding transcriptional LysR family regulator